MGVSLGVGGDDGGCDELGQVIGVQMDQNQASEIKYPQFGSSFITLDMSLKRSPALNSDKQITQSAANPGSFRLKSSFIKASAQLGGRIIKCKELESPESTGLQLGKALQLCVPTRR
ncbi:hypothetical protein AKJ16_DCAP24931 [Drosera capensis]